ncbi:inositol monophosphatase family protein [Spirabiliibacterium falconis]|uniref:inositol monophosphatase family protein n=1 Tax=Spirabiliibacterium falconis TaxID=572023 RepID=UPI001AAC94AA|nr:inositol monophosphatase [Spirabiliibacterium falconis]MBE2894577.1 inositol monophosphatase [Spirabiliibacterium falconis]
MSIEISKRYQCAKEIILTAGELAYHYYLQRGNLSVQTKQDDQQNLVSEADRNVEQHIKTALLTHFPADGFLGEESGARDVEKDFCWVVDPIDGTSAFLHGLHGWCISIALLHHKKVVLGLIFDPNHNELFHAQKGEGAFVNKNALHAAEVSDFTAGLIGLGYTHRFPHAKMGALVDHILNRGGMFYRNGSAALMLAYVAAGRLIAHFEPYIYAWDCLAGILLVEEAGGESSDFLNTENWLESGYVLVASRGIFAQLNSVRQSL